MSAAKYFLRFSLILLVLLIIFIIFSKVSPTKKNTDLEKVKSPEKNITLAFVGDMMLDRGVKNSVYKNFSGDYNQLFIKVIDRLKSYDLLFANLEGPVSDKGIDVGGQYSFRMEPKILPVLKKVGFDVFSIANNHIFNWGGDAFQDTLQLLAKTGISYVGDSDGAAILNIEEIKIAFLGFSEFPSVGINLISDDLVRDSILKAKLGNNLAIVSFHFGEEYQTEPNDYQIKYARLAVDSGADLIIGHHPHVIQTLEKYKNSYIIYSLGNFIFDQYFSEATMSGGLLEVEVNASSKKIEKINLRKVNLNRLFQIESIK